MVKWFGLVCAPCSVLRAGLEAAVVAGVVLSIGGVVLIFLLNKHKKRAYVFVCLPVYALFVMVH